jgi:hypothetical protein
VPFDIEEIPDPDFLYYRIHKNNVVDGKIIPGVFKAKGGVGMSTDWSKYSTAEEALKRASTPESNGIISLNVGRVRKIKELAVKHVPIEGNQAHSEVYGVPEKGELKTKVRALLMEIYSWEIKYPR